MIEQNLNKMIMSAMKSGDKVKAGTYKLIKAKFLEFKTAKNAKPLDEQAEITIIQKMVKEREDDLKLFKQAGRLDSEVAKQTELEIPVLKDLLPQIPSEDDVEKYLTANYPNGINKADMGKVIKEVKANLLGVPGNIVANLVKSKLV